MVRVCQTGLLGTTPSILPDNFVNIALVVHSHACFIINRLDLENRSLISRKGALIDFVA
jgi:hypothetical protein